MAKYRKSGCPRDSTAGGFKGDRRQLPNSLSSGAALSNRPVWLDIEITTDDYLHDIQRRIQTLTESLPVEVLLVRRSREQRERSLANERRETLSELSVEEVFARRLALEALDTRSASA